jgi:hypothetical protein
MNALLSYKILLKTSNIGYIIQVMPYFLFILALLIGFYGLYRFFLNANVDQIKSFFLVLAAIVMAVSLFYMAITGRLAGAIAFIAAATPIALGFIKERQRKKAGKTAARQNDEKMTRKKALEILGLKDNATEKDIEDAYKKLMKKTHPDQEGSEWLAAQINHAHDFLKGK